MRNAYDIKSLDPRKNPYTLKPRTLTNNHISVDISQMTESEIHVKILKGYNSYKEGKTKNAANTFEDFRNNIAG